MGSNGVVREVEALGQFLDGGRPPPQVRENPPASGLEEAPGRAWVHDPAPLEVPNLTKGRGLLSNKSMNILTNHSILSSVEVWKGFRTDPNPT
jgi:hypothetical protein